MIPIFTFEKSKSTRNIYPVILSWPRMGNISTLKNCCQSSSSSTPDISLFFSQIVHRYDIILIQEVRDSDLSATKKLMEQVNKSEPTQTNTHKWRCHTQWIKRYSLRITDVSMCVFFQRFLWVQVRSHCQRASGAKHLHGAIPLPVQVREKNSVQSACYHVAIYRIGKEDLCCWWTRGPMSTNLLIHSFRADIYFWKS